MRPAFCPILGVSPLHRRLNEQRTSRGVPGHGGSMTDMLMVTTTVRVVDGVHSHTTSTCHR
jgi:hypothetical protein